MLGAVGIRPITETAPLAKAAAAKAQSLDPANPESHRILAVIAAAYDHDWKTAESYYRRAMAHEPISPLERYCWYTYYLLLFGRVPEATVQSRLALDSDPLSMTLHFGRAWCLYSARRYQESIECTRRALEIDPNSYFIWHVMGLAQLGAGLAQEAIASLQRAVHLAPWYHIAVGSLAAAYVYAGDQEHGREWALKLVESDSRSVGAALYYAARGEADAMFEQLEGGYQQRDVFLLYIHLLPLFEPYGTDSRFQALLAKMNLR